MALLNFVEGVYNTYVTHPRLLAPSKSGQVNASSCYIDVISGFLAPCVVFFASVICLLVLHSDGQFHANCCIPAENPQHFCDGCLLREQGKPYGGANMPIFLFTLEDVACWLPDTLAVVIRRGKQSR